MEVTPGRARRVDSSEDADEESVRPKILSWIEPVDLDWHKSDG